MNIMEIGLNTLQQIGTNYSVRLNDKEVLVYEDDSSRVVKKSDGKKLQEKQETQKSQEPVSTKELSQGEKQMLVELQARDAEVRSHEAAHQSGGAATGGASYTYQQGPDGKMYAIGGEVSVSFSSGSTPEETIANAQAVISSAMAPGSPSGQDMAVASSARMMIMKAQQQKSRELQEEIKGYETYKNETNKSSNQDVQKPSGIDIPA